MRCCNISFELLVIFRPSCKNMPAACTTMKNSLLILTLTALLNSLPQNISATVIPEDCRTGGIALGCQAWTFREYSVLEAIDKTGAAGGKVIELYPGQKFSPEQPELKFDHNATDEMIATVKARLEKTGVRAVNYGVVSIPKDEAAARKIFEFAKKFELYGITTESADALDTIERLVKEYDICIGLHNHPRKPKDPAYKMWDPKHILGLVETRDQRIGSAADLGHWVRSGLDPVDCLKLLKGRVISTHLKDLNEKSPQAHDVPFGNGVTGIPAVIAELKQQGFAGNASIEYEFNWKNNVTDVAQCVGFIRGLAAK